MIEKIIEYIVVSIALGVVGMLVKSAIKKATDGNKEILGSISENITGIGEKINDLSKEFTDLKIELPEKYLKCREFEKFKEENRDGHKELRIEMHELIEKRN